MVHYAKNVLGMAITGYSSFGPQSFYELGAAQDVPSLLSHDLVTSIAQQVKKSKLECRPTYFWLLLTKFFPIAPAQVLLRWATQRGIAVIPKSNNQARLEENLTVTNFDLTEEQLKTISSLNRNLR